MQNMGKTKVLWDVGAAAWPWREPEDGARPLRLFHGSVSPILDVDQERSRLCIYLGTLPRVNKMVCKR